VQKTQKHGNTCSIVSDEQAEGLGQWNKRRHRNE